MMTRRFLPTTRWFGENKKKCSVLFRRTRPVIKARPTQTDRGERGVIVWTIGVANREHICTLFFFYTRFDMHEMQRHCWARPSNDGSKAAEMYTRNNRAVIIDREEKKKKVFPFSFLFFCAGHAQETTEGERDTMQQKMSVVFTTPVLFFFCRLRNIDSARKMIHQRIKKERNYIG